MSCFRYIDICEKKGIFSGYSDGHGLFAAAPSNQAPLAFIAIKERRKETLTVYIRSEELRQVLEHVLRDEPRHDYVDLATLLHNYDALRQYANVVRDSHWLPDYETSDLSLFMDRFITAPYVFDGFNLDDLHQKGWLLSRHRQILEQRSFEDDLHNLKDMILDPYQDGSIHDQSPEDDENLQKWIQAAINDDVKAIAIWLKLNPECYRAPILEKALNAAVMANSYQAAKRLISFCSPSVCSPDRLEKPLKIACARGFDAIVELLLDAGASVEGNLTYRFEDGSSSQSSEYDRVGVPDESIFGSAALKTSGKTPSTPAEVVCNNPLAAACAGGHLKVVSLLIEHNARVNFFPFGPLYHATTENHLEVISYLCQNGATIDCGPHRMSPRPLLSKMSSFRTDIVNFFMQNITESTCCSCSMWGEVDTGRRAQSNDFQNLCKTMLQEELFFKSIYLRKCFRDLHSRFYNISQQNQSSLDLVSLGEKLSNYKVTLRLGYFTLNQFFEKRPPETVDQIVSCVLLACAMKNCIDKTSNNFALADDFHEDLDRWRFVLAYDRHPLFDEVCLALWNKQPNLYLLEEDISDQNDLRYRTLVTGLVKSMYRPGFGESRSRPGETFSTIQTVCEDRGKASEATEHNHSTTIGGMNQELPYNGYIEPEQFSKKTLFQFTIADMMMAGAIFGTFVLFLLLLHGQRLHINFTQSADLFRLEIALRLFCVELKTRVLETYCETLCSIIAQKTSLDPDASVITTSETTDSMVSNTDQFDIFLPMMPETDYQDDMWQTGDVSFDYFEVIPSIFDAQSPQPPPSLPYQPSPLLNADEQPLLESPIYTTDSTTPTNSNSSPITPSSRDSRQSLRRPRRRRASSSGSQYPCYICNRPYATNSNMLRHVREDHLGEGEKNCLRCGKSLCNPRYAKDHQNTRCTRRGLYHQSTPSPS